MLNGVTRSEAGHLPASAPDRSAEAGPSAGAPAGRSEIAEVVQGVIATLNGDLTAADLSLFHELEGLARFIHSAKAEISALCPDEIREKHLPSATDELDAIVGATADATGVILDAVERMEAIGGKIGGDHGREIAERVTRIYEACNFQDITGQRITKVVKTLKQIEYKVEALVQAFGGGMGRDRVGVAPGAAVVAAATEVNGKPDDRSLLNGPQLPANAPSQADIDAMFS